MDNVDIKSVHRANPFLETHGSRCIFSVLLRGVNAIKVWANAIKIQDQYEKVQTLF